MDNDAPFPLRLPVELLHHVCRFLPSVRDLASLSLICRAMYAVTRDEQLWASLPVTVYCRLVHPNPIRYAHARTTQDTVSVTFPNRRTTVMGLKLHLCGMFSACPRTTFLCIGVPDVGLVCFHVTSRVTLWDRRVRDGQIFYMARHALSEQIHFYVEGDSEPRSDPLAWSKGTDITDQDLVRMGAPSRGGAVSRALLARLHLEAPKDRPAQFALARQLLGPAPVRFRFFLF